MLQGKCCPLCNAAADEVISLSPGKEADLAFFCPVTYWLTCFHSGACNLGKKLVWTKCQLMASIICAVLGSFVISLCCSCGGVLCGSAAVSMNGLVLFLALCVFAVLLALWPYLKTKKTPNPSVTMAILCIQRHRSGVWKDSLVPKQARARCDLP